MTGEVIMGVKNYKELEVWQKAMELVVHVYRVSKNFPKEELFALTNQLRRAAVSIPSNIAEGFGRDSHKDFVNFLLVSRGSLFEVGTQLDIATRLGYVSITDDIEQLMDSIARMLGSLIRKLRTSAPSTNSPRSHQAPSTRH
jgi:four helix bundle protein